MKRMCAQCFAAVALAMFVPPSALCGASPLEAPERRVLPQPRGPVGGRGSLDASRVDAPASQPAGPGAGPSHRLVRQDTEDGRLSASDPRLARVSLYPGTRTVIPPAWTRCSAQPTPLYWRQRDLMAEIQWLSRRGFIPVTALGDTVDTFSDYVQMPSGWRAYGVSVPPGGTVQVEVKHEKLGWFRLMLVDKWGQPGPGMLQAAIAHQPVMVTYKNPGKEATAVYVIVDDPAWWSDARDPYTLAVRRDWDPATTDLSRVKVVTGLWGASPSVSAEFRHPSLTGPAVYPR